jgi:hypothetical protein
MANKDISATVIANILNLISTASAFATATMKETKSYKEGISRRSEFLLVMTSSPNPGGANKDLQTWFNTYIKPGATSAGTATVSSKFTTTAQWRTDFFNTRTQLLANASPEAIAALDGWFAKYTSYKVEFKRPPPRQK